MRLLFILVYLPFAAACSSGSRPVEDQSPTRADPEESVWAAVLATFISDSTQQLVIVDSARALPARIIDRQALSQRFPQIDGELIQRYVSANANNRAMPDFADVGVPVVRVDEDDLAFPDARNPDEYWDAFYSAYPNSPGLIRLFRVGFDPLLEQALLFVSHACGGRCGCGRYTLLSRVDDAWVVVGTSTVLCS